ncbi:MAG: 7TM-DISM domain-containing protein [Vicingaceae bacterium]
MRHCIFFLSLLFSSLLWGQENVVSLHHIGESKHLAQEALILEDPDHQYSFQDILHSDSLKEHFFQADSDIPYMDFTASTYWMKLQIRNDSDEKQSFYVELARPLTNKVNLYVFDKDLDLIEVFQAGDELPFKERPYQHRKFVFPLEFPAHSNLTLVVETRSDGEILKLPFKVWDVEAFTQFASTENFFLGLYYGLFILVIVLFSFFGLALRQNLYLFFVLYVFVLGVFQFSLDGLAYKYFWPCFPWVGNHAILIMAAISMTFMLLYVKKFLQFGDEHASYLRVYHGFIGLILIALVCSLTNGILYQYSFPVLNGLSFITVLYILYGLYLKFKSDDKPDLPVLFAFIGLVMGAILFITANTNFINSEFLAANALKLGSATEVMFLSIAMAGRYRKTQQEKIAAQEEAFNRLEEVNTLKEEQNTLLEKQVAERTEEISRQNDQLSAQNKEIINSINYAQRLQSAILPADSALKDELNDPAILFLPKDIVSGDFYWMEVTEEQVYFAVADCTGHGVPGALVSVVGHNALNRCVKELGLTDPAKILDQLTLIVEHTFSKEKTKVSDGMDIALCVWDRKDTLHFAGAFNPLYLIRDKELIEIKGDKQPIGKFVKRDPFTSHEVKLHKDDAIILFSDGYADQFGGPRGKKLKYSRFKEYLLELNHLKGEALSTELDKRIKDWQGEEEQIDDICVMKVQF